MNKKILYHMPLNKSIEILKKIKKQYDIDTVDIGALEPFLYKDDIYNIIDFITAIEQLSLKVKITTNGSLLYKYIEGLKQTNIEKIRISLHSLDKDIFYKISNNKTSFDYVKRSIIEAKESGLPIELNTIIFKGYENQVIKIIDFCIEYNINLKLYNLYYSPYYQNEFEQYYLSSENIIDFITHKFKKYEIIKEKNISKRERIILKIKNVQFIIKEDKDVDRTNKYCQSCEYINSCGEQFAEYFRIDPDLYFYPCYLRKDLRFNLNDDNILSNLNEFNKQINIRLIVSPICNFKCSFPDDKNNFWCLKQGGNYEWQGIKN